MELDVHIAQATMSTRNEHKCKVIPIMYDMSSAKVSEITAEKKKIFHNLTQSVVFIADGTDWCSDLGDIVSGTPHLSTDIEYMTHIL